MINWQIFGKRRRRQQARLDAQAAFSLRNLEHAVFLNDLNRLLDNRVTLPCQE
jgi:hypothetical protein